jgi:hypothetical protein
MPHIQTVSPRHASGETVEVDRGITMLEISEPDRVAA